MTDQHGDQRAAERSVIRYGTHDQLPVKVRRRLGLQQRAGRR